MTGLGTCGFPGTAEQEFFPWPAAPPCPAGLVLVLLTTVVFRMARNKYSGVGTEKTFKITSYQFFLESESYYFYGR